MQILLVGTNFSSLEGSWIWRVFPILNARGTGRHFNDIAILWSSSVNQTRSFALLLGFELLW